MRLEVFGRFRRDGSCVLSEDIEEAEDSVRLAVFWKRDPVNVFVEIFESGRTDF